MTIYLRTRSSSSGGIAEISGNIGRVLPFGPVTI